MHHGAPRGMATLLKIAKLFSYAVVSRTHELLVANSCRPPLEAIRRDHMVRGVYAWLAVHDALCWQGGSLEEGCAVSAGVPPDPIVH
jgi:hypothetical protein